RATGPICSVRARKVGAHHQESRHPDAINRCHEQDQLRYHHSWSSLSGNTMTATPDTTPASKPAQRIRPVPAVTRAIAILRLLGKTKEAMNVKSISDELGLVPSTCLHILRALTAEKLLAFDSASKRYRLGTGMLVLARSVMDTNSFAQVVQPTLDLVSEKWGVTAIGVEVDLHHMVVTALSRSKLPFRLH